MDPPLGAHGRGSQDPPTIAAPASPTSRPASSSLSPAYSEPGSPADTPRDQHATVDAEHGTEDSAAATAPSLGSPLLAPARDSTANETSSSTFDCSHCDKTYASSKQLSRHLADKRSVCYRERTTAGSVSRWVCPRCHLELSPNYSMAKVLLTNHVHDSCWKICDECCEDGSQRCDGTTTEGDCSACEQAGRSCTKHDKPIPDCSPQRLTGPPSQLNNSSLDMPESNATKRKAGQSPDRSPEAKPKTKRRGRSVKKEIESRVDEETEFYLGDLEDGHQDPAPRFPNVSKSPAIQSASSAEPKAHSAFDSTRRSLLSPIDFGDRDVREGYPTSADAMSEMTANHHPAQMSETPPCEDESEDEAEEESEEEESEDQSTVPDGSEFVPVLRQTTEQREMAQRFEYLNRLMAPVDPSQYLPQPMPGSQAGNGLGYGSFPVSSAVGLGSYAGFPAGRQMGQTAYGSMVGTSSLAPGFSAAVSRAPSGMPTMLPIQRPASGSQVPSRQPSRQPSHQPSLEQRRVSGSTNMNTDDEEEDHTNQDRLIVKLPLRHGLDPKPSLALATTKIPAPTIRLRIHTNTYDRNNIPIFSILTIATDAPFGPSLEYYCAQRGLRFGQDLYFIYRWPAPIPENPSRERYVDITYRMTPATIKDKEYPSAACSDGDTIWAMKPRADKPTPTNPLANMFHPECDLIAVQTGETEIYQHRAVAQQWSRITEIKLANQRHRITELEREVAVMEQNHALQNSVIGRLQQANTGLNRQLAMTRQHGQQVVANSVYGGYMPQGNGMGTGFMGAGRQ